MIGLIYSNTNKGVSLPVKKVFRTEAEWLSIISTCRSSGLSDHEWCLNNDIAPSSFYHAIERARSKKLPVAAHTSSVFPVRQEAVEIDLSPLEEVPKKPICDSDAVAIRASVRGLTLDITNNASSSVINDIIGALLKLC